MTVTRVVVSGMPLVIKHEGKRIHVVMRPDGTTFVPSNPRFMKRVRAQFNKSAKEIADNGK